MVKRSLPSASIGNSCHRPVRETAIPAVAAGRAAIIHRTMADKHDFAFSRREAPGVLLETLLLPDRRTQGRPGARRTRGLAGCLQ